MTRLRLFWKILLGFLVTFLLMTQAVWLLFALRDDRELPAFLMTEQIGPAVLEAATQALSAGGRPRYEQMARNLPWDQRQRLDLLEARRASPFSGDPEDAVLERRVRDPSGTEWVLRFRYHRDREPWRFNVPPELLGIGFVAGLLFSAFLAWYLVRPINHLRNGFQRLARGELTVRVSPEIGRRRDEVADLAHEFDGMARRLEHLVASRDRLLHDVSHELRSPLARLQLAIALARQTPDRFEHSMDRMEREVERLDGMVGELLMLARAENDRDSEESYFDLVEVTASVVADAQYEAQPKGVKIDFTVPDRGPDRVSEDLPPVRGNAELLRSAIDNVVRNALRHSPRGGRIEVRAELLSRPETFRISVSDEGPGVADGMETTMFEPFVRGAAVAGGGFGLGLTIASRAVATCRGSIAAANRAEGGLRVTIEVPV
ncbi:sensor histidine kinase [Novosphingobium sp.]|jgi:two-component system OmpR family sensor kinase|uniref:sensor histidine kinase n=1 Tax=Novosphingobium sp. TaxID=1874826 RepID=UPI002FE3D298